MFKQLQPIGILLSIISMITTLVPLIFEQLNSQKYEHYYRIFHITEIASVLLVISYAGSLILIYRAFMHVNQRNASDFYDSLPNTRTCRFNSLALAALTWMSITIPFLIPATMVELEGSIIFIIMALTVSLAFELITTRKGKQMLKSLPSFVLVVVFAFGFSYATKGIGKAMVNQIPQRFEIESICIETSTGYSYGSTSYLKYLTKDIQFDDEQMIDTALNALNKNIDMIKENNRKITEESYSYNITFNLRDNKTLVRKLEVTRDESELFYTNMSKNPTYRKRLYNVPSLDMIELGNLNVGKLQNEEAKKRVYAIYQQEMKDYAEGKISQEAENKIDQQLIHTVGDLVWPIESREIGC